MSFGLRFTKSDFLCLISVSEVTSDCEIAIPVLRNVFHRGQAFLMKPLSFIRSGWKWDYAYLAEQPLNDKPNEKLRTETWEWFIRNLIFILYA